jgi:hypothetical protein
MPGAWTFGIEPYSGLWYGNAPEGTLFFDSTQTFYGGYIQNHTLHGPEVGKNALATDGSVRWYTRTAFGWNGVWPCPEPY